MKFQIRIITSCVSTSLLLLAGLLVACQGSQVSLSISQPSASPQLSPTSSSQPNPQISQSTDSNSDFLKVQQMMVASCLPCHDHQTLPTVIERVKQANFNQIEGLTRLRLLAELEELEHLMQNGLTLSFTNQEELHRFFVAEPGTLYLMLEKGKMPPAWAAELFKQINWPGYQTLTIENRIELLKYAKSFQP